ncbi:MAG: hypothetical protein GY797_37220 [Deltaproteobacteria bacterium]|nr:hypothetical protein [Deltaproteobacteria bacterium]
MQNPEIEFSKWTKWKNREALKGIRHPGVYLLAHFDVAPDKPANPTTKQIIYIGETCNQNLRKRWYQFNRSAFEGKIGHSGGSTYRQVFDNLDKNLYVAAFSVDQLDEELQPFFIRYVERKLIWDFVLQHNAAPVCNRK